MERKFNNSGLNKLIKGESPLEDGAYNSTIKGDVEEVRRLIDGQKKVTVKIKKN